MTLARKRVKVDMNKDLHIAQKFFNKEYVRNASALKHPYKEEYYKYKQLNEFIQSLLQYNIL